MRWAMIGLAILLGAAAQSSGTALAQHPPGRFVQVNGARLWVEEEGRGEPLILIPGGPGASQLNFHPWFSRLAKHRRVIYFDAYGRGRSDRATDTRAYTFERDVRDLDGSRAALGLEHVDLYGFSYGGLVAQAYTLRHAERVRRLILASTLHGAEMWQAKNDAQTLALREQYPEEAAKMQALRERGVLSTEAAYQSLDTSPYALMWLYDPRNELLLKSEPGSFNPDVYRAIGGADADRLVGGDAANLDFRAQLPNLRLPVLVLAGRFDRIFPPRWSLDFKRLIPGAEFEMFEHSGHYPQIEETDPWASKVNAFLDRP